MRKKESCCCCCCCLTVSSKGGVRHMSPPSTTSPPPAASFFHRLTQQRWYFEQRLSIKVREHSVKQPITVDLKLFLVEFRELLRLAVSRSNRSTACSLDCSSGTTGGFRKVHQSFCATDYTPVRGTGPNICPRKKHGSTVKMYLQ